MCFRVCGALKLPRVCQPGIGLIFVKDRLSCRHIGGLPILEATDPPNDARQQEMEFIVTKRGFCSEALFGGRSSSPNLPNLLRSDGTRVKESKTDVANFYTIKSLFTLE